MSLICRAEDALRPASSRTSLATTAKPRPLSPALAASTAALRASKLVWKAMPSITDTISLMSLLAVLTSSMANTVSCDNVPPSFAMASALSASCTATPDSSATWPISSSILLVLALASSRFAACSSVLELISVLLLAISPALCETWLAAI